MVMSRIHDVTETWRGVRLDPIPDRPYGNVGLKIEPPIWFELLIPFIPPLVLDDRPSLYTRQREREAFDTEIARLVQGALENRVWLQFQNGAIGLDGAAFDTRHVVTGKNRDSDRGEPVAAAVGKDLDPDILGPDSAGFPVHHLIAHAHFPKDAFRVGVLFHDRGFAAQIGGVDGFPIRRAKRMTDGYERAGSPNSSRRPNVVRFLCQFGELYHNPH